VLTRLRHTAVVAVLLLVTGCGGSGALGDADDAVQANATVVRIVDGDTLVVEADGVDERVRLIGINTPESVDQNRPVMCFGKEASAHLEELLPEGTPVRLERDVEPRDRYDRLLAYVYRAADGEFVNLAMVRDGYAQQYTFPPNVAHSEQFGDAERAARRGGVGLWSACDEPFEQ
jgi:micrococcal nuclease